MSLLCKNARFITRITVVVVRTAASVFCMDDAFELLSKLNVYVQGVRLIPVGFTTKLNTLFDIATVRKRK